MHDKDYTVVLQGRIAMHSVATHYNAFCSDALQCIL